MKRRLTEEEIRNIDRRCPQLYTIARSLDTFFVESMAADAGLSRATLLHRLPSLPWVVLLDPGLYGSCVSSMQAYRLSRRESDQRHADHTHWSTTVSGLSAIKK